MANSWKYKPLGIAVVDETSDGGVVVSHVSVRVEGVAQTGMWLFTEPTAEDLAPRLSHWVVIGTQDGVARVEVLLGEKVATGDLASLVKAAEESEAELVATWTAFKDEEPIKRANLVALESKTWPSVTKDGEAAEILKRVGRASYVETTPEMMRDSLALTRLVSYVLNSWWDLETERLSRKYLNEGDKNRRLLPLDWVASNPPWWPRKEG